MQNIRLTLQYNGTRYLGWQRPPKDGFEKTVSYKIISALRRMTGEDIFLHAGAKTEPGVHALSQTVSFLTEAAFSPEQFRAELNRFLPQDIAVLSAEAAPERFRADLNAKMAEFLNAQSLQSIKEKSLKEHAHHGEVREQPIIVHITEPKS